MLSRLQALVIRISTSGWLYLFVAALMGATLFSLMQIGAVFPAHAAGAQPFDLQNELTAGQVYPQIAGYTERARELYYLFTAIDYVFPFVAGLFIAATASFGLRHAFPAVYGWAVERNLLPLFMLGSAFDWLENLSIITTMGLYPAEVGALPLLIVLAKRCKLAFVVVGQALAVLLVVIGLYRRWRTRRRGAASKA